MIYQAGLQLADTKLLLASCVGLGYLFFVVAPTMRSMREAFARFWFGRESWRGKGFRFIGRTKSGRASRMGILLIAEQLRTNRQIFTPKFL